VLEVPVGTPLRMTEWVKRAATSVQLEEGAAVLCTRMGLSSGAARCWTKGSNACVGHFRPEEPQLLCNELLRSAFASQAPADDVAIVVTRRRPKPAGTLP
jgi:hypothetical protein